MILPVTLMPTMLMVKVVSDIMSDKTEKRMLERRSDLSAAVVCSIALLAISMKVMVAMHTSQLSMKMCMPLKILHWQAILANNSLGGAS
jgi:uncharacterized membrane-anchored protein